jgi:hypothetical protein
MVKNEVVVAQYLQVTNGCKSSAWSGQSGAVLIVIADLLSCIYIFEWKLSITLHIEQEHRPAQSFLVQLSVSECNLTGTAMTEENFHY